MCKFDLIFRNCISFSRVVGQSKIAVGQSELNQNSQRYHKFYFLKSNLTHNL